MIPFRRILFPVGFSPACLAVVPHVREMVKHNHAQLTLFHAADPTVLVFGPNGEGLLTNVPAWKELVEAENARLNAFAAGHFAGLRPMLVLKEGDPGASIAREVAESGCDLVMMPTRGEGLFRRLLIGSVAAKVLHDVSCAVWTGVHGLEAGGMHPGIGTVMCAVNFDEETAAIARAAGALAKSHGARLILVHAVETPAMALELDYAPMRQSLLDGADLSLRKLAAEHGLEGSIQVLEGPTSQAIGDAAAAEGADLLVVGRGASQGLLSQFWTRLYSIVSEAPCPVLSI